MGAAESSVQRDGKSKEDATASASAGELSAEVSVHQEGSGNLDSKPLQENGQISSLTSLNGHSEDNTLAEVGQPDGVSVAQKEESPETMDAQDEVATQVNGDKVEKESADANEISVEEKAAEEKPGDAGEVGFKKIFRFVGFKFTLKKDKSEEKDPVKLLTVKDKGEEVSGNDEPAKVEEAAAGEEKSTAEEKEADTEASTAEAEAVKDSNKAETTDVPAEGTAAEATDEVVKEDGAEKEGESAAPSQETTMSPFRKLFSTGLFSNLRKKASIKKTKEEEDKEEAVEEETAKPEETAATEEKEAKDEVEQETKEAAPATLEEEKSEPKEEAPASPEGAKSEPEVTTETPSTDENKQEEEKGEPSEESEKAPAEVTSEAELLASQEKAKPQGSPLRKLFTGAGLKKLSTKKQKTKKEAESKLTESGEQAAEHLQSSTESAEAPKGDSGPSSPEDSGEHVITVEVSQETDGEVASDGEKKKEGIIAWSSFKKLVTPKKRVKRSSESEDEATAEKPAKSATLSSSESAPLADKSVEEEAKEEEPAEEEPKTENAEKLVSSTEEPKKKMDSSVSWEALMCMGGPKKRTRKTSDSDDDETKIEEELPAAASATTAEEGEHDDTTEAAIVTSGSTESEGEVASSPERESTWDTLKRMIKNKTKGEEKLEESAEQVQSDSEAPKDESSFSLRKFLPGRKKKKADKQASNEQVSGEEDSDTPAVVPLSEYDEQVEAEQEAPAEPAPVQVNVTAEDRAPSWIPAHVEETEEKHDELSDIPEEAENAATPKSVDTDGTEDEIEDEAPPPPRALGRRLSLAEMKPVAQAPAGATTPVPKGPKPESAEEVIEAIEATVTEIPPEMSVAVVDVPIEVASEQTEYEPPIENAESNTSTALEPHAPQEAIAICTGLGTKEIAKVALEKPAMPITECLTVIHDSLSTEVLKEELPPSKEEAILTEDPVLTAEVYQVETTELEPVVEITLNGVASIQAARESYEPEIEKVGIESFVLEESEVVHPTIKSENSPKAEVVDPITQTTETALYAQSVEVSEPTVETKEVEFDTEQVIATVENTPITDVIPNVKLEISSTITKEIEPAVSEVAPGQEVPVIMETVVLVAPVSADPEQMETSDVVITENASVSGQVDNENVAEATTIQTALSDTNAIIEQASEKMEKVEEEIMHVSEIEAQSKIIAEAVIQDAMDKVSEDMSDPEKPTTPTDSVPEPVQAVATTEKEIEITTETPIITETLVAVCEKPAPKSPKPLHVAVVVTDKIPTEVTESIDVEEEKKPEEGLKKAVEVEVSEETVVEEVVEIKAESQTGEELEQVKEEQSKEDTEVQEPDVKEATEEVKPESEEAKSEEDKEEVLAIHMPVQVVLQTAQVFEEVTVEEEAVVEFDSNGLVSEDTSVKPESAPRGNKLSTLSEEPQDSEEEDPEEAASQPDTEKKSSGKCAEVMAQVIEVIEEAVKEIEPVSTEITAAS